MIDLQNKYKKQTQLAAAGLGLVCASIALHAYDVFFSSPFSGLASTLVLPVVTTLAALLGKALCTQLAAYLGGGSEINKSLGMDILALCLSLPVMLQMVNLFSATSGWLALGSGLCSLMGFLFFLSYLRETSMALEDSMLTRVAEKLISYFWILFAMVFGAIVMVFIPVLGALYLKLLYALICAWGVTYLFLLGSLCKKLFQAIS